MGGLEPTSPEESHPATGMKSVKLSVYEARVTNILNNMAMITNKEESPRVEHVNLHANKTIRMPRQMMQCDTLTKV